MNIKRKLQQISAMQTYARELMQSSKGDLHHRAGVAKVNIDQAAGQLEKMDLAGNRKMSRAFNKSYVSGSLQDHAHQLFADTLEAPTNRLSAVECYAKLLKGQIAEVRLVIGAPQPH